MKSTLKATGLTLFAAILSVFATAQTPVTFVPQIEPLANNNYTDVSNAIAVDLNNDGVPDMVIPQIPNSTTVLSVSLANGDGTFQAPRQVNISPTPIPEGSVFFGDFNNDGKADLGMLITIRQTSGSTAKIAILLGNGDGTFQPTKFTPVVGNSASFALPTYVADYNRDGKQDLATYLTIGSNAGVYIFPGDGAGGFSAPKPAVLNSQMDTFDGGDFDLDNNPDIVYTVLKGSPCTVHDPPCATDVHVIYGNGDFSFGGDSTVYHSNADFNFSTGDLNSDGHTDIFGFDDSGTPALVALYGQQPGRTFTTFSMPSGPVQYVRPAMADLNGDGKMDILVYGDSSTYFTYNQYVVFLANSAGGFTRENQTTPAYGVAPFIPILVDLNRDNKPDILEPARQPDNTGFATIVALNRTTGSFPTCPYPDLGQSIASCSPSLNPSSPVHFIASANTFGQAHKMELWVDGKKTNEQFHAWGQRAWFDLSASFPAGIHYATLFAEDIDNHLQKVSFPFMSGAVCSAPANPGVHVCLPVNNSTTKSPVTVQAAAKVTGVLDRMEVWIDGVKKLTTTSQTSITAAWPLAAGKHKVVVYAVGGGIKYSSAVNFTVN